MIRRVDLVNYLKTSDSEMLKHARIWKLTRFFMATNPDALPPEDQFDIGINLNNVIEVDD